MNTNKTQHFFSNMAFLVWKLNILLVVFYLVLMGPGYFKSSVLEFSNIKSDPFDGTVSPIAYIPNWLHTANQNKSLWFNDIDATEFIALPKYDLSLMADSSGKNKDALIERYTYTTPYMGSYRLNYTEYDGSHCGVDIRVPFGTPVMSIANGVVVKAVTGDSSNGNYVVVRHDDVPLDGTVQTIYSNYLHLSSVSVTAGDKIARGTVVGKSGMSGTATAPHLHFQIDKSSAPYHTYWPYTYKEAADAGLDFFGAINAGLGKEAAMKYTIHPITFTYAHLVSFTDPFNGISPDTPASSETQSATTTDTTTTIKTSGSISTNTGASTTTEPSKTTTDTVKNPTPTADSDVDALFDPLKNVDDTTPLSSAPTENSQTFFSDVDTSAAYATRLKTLVSSGVVSIGDGRFWPNGEMNRRDFAIILARMYASNVDASNITLPFLDVEQKDTVAYSALQKLYSAGVIGANTKFR